MHDDEKLNILFTANTVNSENEALAGSQYDYAKKHKLPIETVQNADNNLLQEPIKIDKIEPKTKQFLLDNPARTKIFNNVASTDRLNKIEQLSSSYKNAQDDNFVAREYTDEEIKTIESKLDLKFTGNGRFIPANTFVSTADQQEIDNLPMDKKFKDVLFTEPKTQEEYFNIDPNIDVDIFNDYKTVLKKGLHDKRATESLSYGTKNINTQDVVQHRIGQFRDYGKALNAGILMQVLDIETAENWQHYAEVDKPMLQDLVNKYADIYNLETIDVSELEKEGASWGSVGKKLTDTFTTAKDFINGKSEKIKNFDNENIFNNDSQTMNYINDALEDNNIAKKGSTTGKKVADTIAASTAFMAEFAVSAMFTGGWGSFAKMGVKQGFKQVVKNSVKNTLNLGRLELQRNALVSPKLLAEAMNERHDVTLDIDSAKNIVAGVKKTDLSVVENFSNKLISNFIEGYIERSGGLFIGSAFGKAVSKIPVAKVTAKIPNAVKQNIFATFVAKNSAKLANFGKKAQKVTAFNGFIAENFEEEVTAFSNYLLTQVANETNIKFLNMHQNSPTVLGNMNENSLIQLSSIGSSSLAFASLGLPANLQNLRLQKNMQQNLELQEKVVELIHEEKIASKSAVSEYFEEVGLDNVLALDANNALTLFQERTDIAKSLNIDDNKLAEIENKAKLGDAVLFDFSEVAVNLKPEQYKMLSTHVEAINGRMQARKIYNQTKANDLAETVKNNDKTIAKEYITKEVQNRNALTIELERLRDELLTSKVSNIDAENTINVLNSYAVTTGYNENYQPSDLLKNLSFQNITAEQLKNGDMFQAAAALRRKTDPNNAEKKGQLRTGNVAHNKAFLNDYGLSLNKGLDVDYEFIYGRHSASFIDQYDAKDKVEAVLSNPEFTVKDNKHIAILAPVGDKYFKVKIKGKPKSRRDQIRSAFEVTEKQYLKDKKNQLPRPVSELSDGLIADSATKKVFKHPLREAGNSNVAESSDNVKQDTFNQDLKGAISFLENGRAVISLIENESDFSTIIHEVGHYIHNMFEDLSASHDASSQIKTDKTLLDVFLDNDTTNEVERKEKFARAFEQYFLEGKAPSKELTGVFAYAKNLLMNIYQGMNILQRELNPTVANIFNRMLATESQISEAFDNFNVANFLEKFDLSGLLGNKDRAVYRNLARNSREQIAHEINAKREKARSKAEKKHRKAANEIITNSAAYKVYNKIRAMGRLNANEVRAAFGESTVKKLADLGLIRFRATPQKRAVENLTEEEKILQTSKNRTRGNKAREEKFNQFLLDNYLILWAMETQGIKKVIPDKMLMINRESYGSFLTDKDGYKNDVAAGLISTTLDFEVTTEELGYYLQDLSKKDIRSQFYKEQKDLADYYNKTQFDNDVEQLTATLYDIAEANNFDNLDNMINTLEKLEKPRVFVQSYIEAKMSDFDRNFNAEEAVIKANNKASEYELLERVLATKSNNEQNILTKRNFNAKVADSLNNMTVRDILNSNVSLALIKKNSRELETATAKKDFDSAFNAAKNLRFNVEKLRQQQKLAKAYEKNIARIRKRLQGKKKNIQGDWLYYFVDLGYRFGLTSSNRINKATVSFEELLENFALENENGITFSKSLIHAPIDSSIYNLNKSQFEETAMLFDFVYSEGRREYTDAIKAEKNGLLAQRESLLASLDKNFTNRLDNRTDSVLKHVKKFAGTYFNNIKNFNTLIEELDNFQYTKDNTPGLFREILYNPVLEAEHDALSRKQTIATELKDVEDYLRTRYRNFDKATLAKLPAFTGEVAYNSRNEWDFMSLFTFALNTGNFDNYNKLQHGYNFNDTQMEQILSALNSADWDIVQKVWDIFETHLSKDLASTYKEINHVNLKMIEADSFEITTSDGELKKMKGGYYPLSYDLNINSDIREKEEAKSVLNAHKNFLSHPTNGMIKERKNNVDRVVSLEYGKLAEALFESIHYIAYEPRLRKVSKLLKNNQLRESIEHKKGKPFYKALNKIVNNVRVPSTNNALLSAKVFEWSRTLAITKALWGNIGASLMQASSFTSGIATVGWHDYVAYNIEFLSNPKMAKNEVFELSPFMRDRFNNVDIDLKKSMNSVKNSKTKNFIKGTANAGYIGIKIMDTAVAFPMWRAAYYQQLEKHGNSKQAVIFADNLIATTQGSSQLKDMSVMQLHPLGRFFTMFTSATQALGNRFYTHGKAITKGQLKGTHAASFIFSEVLIQAMMQGLIRCIASGELDPANERTQKLFASESLGYFFQGLPIVRDAFSFTFARTMGENVYFRGIGSPAAEVPTWAIKTLNDIFQSDTSNEQRLIAISEAVCIPAGLNPAKVYKQLKKFNKNSNNKNNDAKINLNLR
ncbi:hypothetical protein AAEX28_04735 [Lentisphaerota bacterium WC36G]|nr:hypothetical protein LJT99_07595 [Lentisphaerae bacterium WC36]